MLKEIFEQPRVINDGLAGRLNAAHDLPALPELDALPIPSRLDIVACGTSWRMPACGAGIFWKNWAQIPVSVDIASGIPLSGKAFCWKKDGAAIFISQSGETADTLAALRRVNEAGIPTLGLCNVVGSSIAREARSVIFTQAGPEISVALSPRP